MLNNASAWIVSTQPSSSLLSNTAAAEWLIFSGQSATMKLSTFSYGGHLGFKVVVALARMAVISTPSSECSVVECSALYESTPCAFSNHIYSSTPLHENTMSFRFVNTTSDNPEPDEDARKTIRSQAMKDYRRRQRDEEAEGASSRSGSPSSGASQESPSSQQGSDSSKRAKAATASVQRGSASSTSKSTPSGEEVRRRPSVRRDRSEQWLSRRAGQGLFITFSLGAYTPTEPSLNVAGAQHGARPSSHLGRMLQICERYHTWLIPDRATATGFEALGAAKEDSTARMLLFALTLQSIGHLNAIGLSPTDDEEQRFKSQLLTLANRRLQDNTKALDDFTLGALACLTSYEVCSRAALAHHVITGAHPRCTQANPTPRFAVARTKL